MTVINPNKKGFYTCQNCGTNANPITIQNNNGGLCNACRANSCKRTYSELMKQEKEERLSLLQLISAKYDSEIQKIAEYVGMSESGEIKLNNSKGKIYESQLVVLIETDTKCNKNYPNVYHRIYGALEEIVKAVEEKSTHPNFNEKPYIRYISTELHKDTWINREYLLELYKMTLKNRKELKKIAETQLDKKYTWVMPDGSLKQEMVVII